MSRIERFEDIKSWQLAKALVKNIYELTGQASFSKDYSLRDQIQRAAVSIMSNIAEGFERGSKKDFVNFLYIARGSCAEVRSLLYVAFELGYINEDKFKEALQQTEEIAKAIFGFIRYLKSNTL
uniref:S23 ribosomal protein n=1 Tax=Acetithermum autotrophicum TaxID=1446466 RepID=H5SVN9_ACEAU|nr:S23 ribosomal protein [Candidatus Acetothermum autotrophicum]